MLRLFTPVARLPAGVVPLRMHESQHKVLHLEVLRCPHAGVKPRLSGNPLSSASSLAACWAEWLAAGTKPSEACTTVCRPLLLLGSRLHSNTFRQYVYALDELATHDWQAAPAGHACCSPVACSGCRALHLGCASPWLVRCLIGRHAARPRAAACNSDSFGVMAVHGSLQLADLLQWWRSGWLSATAHTCSVPQAITYAKYS